MRGGFALVELLLAAALGGLILAAAAALLGSQTRAAASLVARGRAAEALRVPLVVTAAELAPLVPATDLEVEPRILRLRAFRGGGPTCYSGSGEGLVRYRGLRDPEPEKDSVLVIGSGGERALPLLASAPVPGGCAELPGERTFRWTVPPSEDPAGHLLIFERGSYHLEERAFRYLRGAAGRQPLTEEALVTSASGFRWGTPGAGSAVLVEVRAEVPSGHGNVPVSRRARARLPLLNGSPAGRRRRGLPGGPRRGTEPGGGRRPIAGDTRGGASGRRAPGFVLPAVLLVVLLLATMLPALHWSATQAALLGRTRMATLRARLGARSAIDALRSGWTPGGADPVPPVAQGALPGGVSYLASVESLAGGLRLVSAHAVVGAPEAPTAEARLGRLLLVPDLVSALSDMTAGLLVVAGDPLPGGWPSWERLRVLADAVVEGEVSAHPVELAGACDPSVPTNWGAPGSPDEPCGNHHPLVYADGNLVLAEGAGQGVLLVEGDLTVRAGARFQGLVVVGGALTVEAGAALVGGARVGGEVLDGAPEDDAAVRDLSVRSSPGLAGPFESPARSWIPVFQ